MCSNSNIDNDKSKTFLIISIIFNLMIISSYIFGYNTDELEAIYINTLKKLWKRYPILDISLDKKEGYEKIIFLNLEGINICDCSLIVDYKRIFEKNCNKYKISKGCIEYMPKKASKIFDTKLYAKYYKVDYLTLLSRLSEYKDICKNGYKRCGYLDDLNNRLCVKEEEECPINYLHFDFDFTGNKTSIIKITTANKRDDLPIIIALLISDNQEATIFDINFLDVYQSIKKKNISMIVRNKFKLIPIDDNFPIINKTKFFTDNNLIRGDLKSLENTSPLYLFRLYYPAKYEIDFIFKVYFYLFNYNIFLKIIFFILRCFLFRIIYTKSKNALNIIIFINFCIFMLLNFFFIIGRNNLLNILELNSDLIISEWFWFFFDFIIFYKVLKIILNEKRNNEDKYKKRY